jgi:hypothetical protein
VRQSEVVVEGAGEIGDAGIEVGHGAGEFALVGLVVGEEAAAIRRNARLRMMKSG